ncbi:MAG: thioredoxin family protein [Sphingomonadales bacterium]|nr:thioredoxin family protein [Sphingomonadales bacterium]
MYQKKILFFFFLLLMGVAFAQPSYETLQERPNEKTFKGWLTRATLEQESSFTWMQENYKAYQPHTAGLQLLRQYKDSVRFLVFMGTWCEDSHFIIPRFFAMADAAGLAADRISLAGVDRNKTTWGQLSATLQVDLVPTIIVYRQGKELGRVIEYGRYGQFDREIGEIIQKGFQQ